jgi:hypothetical protein
MGSENSFVAEVGRDLKASVYRMRLEIDEFDLKLPYHVAIYRDDLRCFVVLADIPSPHVHCGVSGALGEILGQVLSTSLANWSFEQITYGTTRWLVRREEPEWRAIRRIKIEGGSAKNCDWLPHDVADPILQMLEGSVPLPRFSIHTKREA